MTSTTDSNHPSALPVVQPGDSPHGGAGGGHSSPRDPAALDAMLQPEEHVLSTLERDGSRRWLYPSLSTGRLWRRRRIVAYALIVIFVAIPHLRIGGEPLVLLDIPAREFTIFGHTFLPTDTPLLALAMVGIFVTIALVTAVGGRLWCGWACPQTVYMEYLFRPIDRLFQGSTGRGGKPRRELTPAMRVLRFGIYLVLSMLLAHTFLAYFVGTDRLAEWIQSSPTEHPIAFLVMAGTTAAMLFDFMFFREQLCLIACPYGRFQSVMLDRSSLIVGYDYGRGEPRGKLSKKAKAAEAPKGDCVDCHRCVAVCPTGIDIRDGLQMECINCTQCIDACNDVMRKIGRPEGLIRYTSQEQLEGKRSSLLRPRTVLYPALLVGIAVAFVAMLSTTYAFDARPLRGPGNPFTRGPDGNLRNSLRLRLVNRSGEPQTYSVRMTEPTGVELSVMDDRGLTLEPGGTSIVPLVAEMPPGYTAGDGSVDATLKITDGSGNERTVEYTLLGPRR